MANKVKRQPKAGEIAFAKAMPFARIERGPASEAIATDYTRAKPGVRITYCKPAHARGSDTWRKGGGMMGGSAGATRGVTANPDVARAFIGSKG